MFPVQLVQSANTKFLTYRANVRHCKNRYYKIVLRFYQTLFFLLKILFQLEIIFMARSSIMTYSP